MLIGVPLLMSKVFNAGAPFDPLSISGCVLWLKAGSLVLNDGDPVGTWTDQSTQGNDVSQTTGSLKPLYKTNIINGLPAVKFDGTDDFMTHASANFPLPMSVFLVVQPTLNTSAQKSYACFTHSNISIGTGFFIVARLSTNFWGTFTNADLSSGNALTAGTSYLLENTAANNSTFLYQRGTQVAFSATTEIAPTGSTVLSLGKDTINSGREYAGYIAEMLVYNSVLSSTNRGNVETYLISKYAL